MFRDATTIIEILNKYGFEAYIVGGTIRDIILKRKPKDVDIATNAKPVEVYSSLIDQYYVVPTGEKFGTVTVVDYFSHKPIVEVTTYRSEGRYSDNRHPDSIKFEEDLGKDLARRDFTMNAIAYNLLTDETVDPFDGRTDIRERKIRAVGNAEERFMEDPLRIMRMCRFVSQLGFDVEPNTYSASRKLSALISNVPVERVRDELLKLLIGDYVINGLNLMMGIGLMEHILPEVARLEGIKQPIQHHKYDVLEHLFVTVLYLPRDGVLRLAGLLHDVGKTIMNKDSPHFPSHVDDGMKMLPSILRRLKLSKEQSAYILFLVQHHMDAFYYINNISNINNISKRSSRRYLSKVKRIDWIGDLRELISADVKASGYDRRDMIHSINLWFNQLYDLIDERRNQPFSKKDLVINGHDLIKIGVPPSKIMGKIQNILLDEVIDNPENNDREYLIKRAEELYKSKIDDGND